MCTPWSCCSLRPTEAERCGHRLRGDRALGDGDRVQQVLDFRPRPTRARGRLKAPSLVGARDNVLFFHDGRFTRLEDAVHFMNDSLGLALSSDDERAITEFLRTR